MPDTYGLVSSGLLQLSNVLIGLLLWIYQLYVGMTLISTLLAVVCWRSARDLALFFRDLLPAGGGIKFFLGFLPVLGLVFLNAVFFPGFQPVARNFFSWIVTLHLIAFGCLSLFQRVDRWIWGLAGAGCLVLATFPLFNLLALTGFPEQFYLVRSFTLVPFDFRTITHYLLFLDLSTLATGTAFLFIYFCWPERKLDLSDQQSKSFRRWGLGLGLGGGLALPPFLLWRLIMLPKMAKTQLIFVLAGVILTLAYFLLLVIDHMIRRCHLKWTPFSFLLAIAIMGLAVFQGQLESVNTNREEIHFNENEAAQHESRTLATWQRSHLRLPADERVLGARIFQEICSSCHSFDRQVLGPSFNAVLPKYRSDPAALKRFITDPVKVNPALPAMPNPGLRSWEIDAIASYLLAHEGNKK